MVPDAVVAEVVASVRHAIAGSIERSFYWLALLQRIAESPDTDLSRVLPSEAASRRSQGLKAVAEVESDLRQIERALSRLDFDTGRSRQ